jgi:hypothetical protein
MRDGKLYNSDYFSRMKGGGEFANYIQKIFDINCRRYNFKQQAPELSTNRFRSPATQQLSFL